MHLGTKIRLKLCAVSKGACASLRPHFSDHFLVGPRLDLGTSCAQVDRCMRRIGRDCVGLPASA